MLSSTSWTGDSSRGELTGSVRVGCEKLRPVAGRAPILRSGSWCMTSVALGILENATRVVSAQAIVASGCCLRIPSNGPPFVLRLDPSQCPGFLRQVSRRLRICGSLDRFTSRHSRRNGCEARHVSRFARACGRQQRRTARGCSLPSPWRAAWAHGLAAYTSRRPRTSRSSSSQATSQARLPRSP